MTQYDNTNRGVLFRNDKKGNQNSPGYKGKINFTVGEGPNKISIDCRLSCWVKQTEEGEFKLMSLQVELPEEAAKPKPAPKPVADPALDDEIPF
jgi:hypothetical protein